MAFKKKIFLKETDSTQDAVLEFPVPSFVFAEKQKGGRGRFGRKWFSPPGGVWFSFSIEDFDFELSPLLTIPVVKFLSNFSVQSRVKLPNDVLVEGKKICGILVEKRDFYVIGVGLNYLNDVPEQISHRAVSLKDILKKIEFSEPLLEPFDVALGLAEDMYRIASKSTASVGFREEKFEELSIYILRGMYSTKIGQVEVINVKGNSVVYRVKNEIVRGKFTDLF